MKKIIIALGCCYLFCFIAEAQQITKVSIQASGLTCSMCSNSINKALKSIDFVEKVDPNIETSTFEISFKTGRNVDFNSLKKKVEDAGFFVSKFVATIRFENIQVKPNEPVAVGDKIFQFVNLKAQELNGEKPVKILNKGFVSAKEFKRNGYLSMPDSKLYYVTM